MSKARPQVGPGLCVGAGAVALCCGGPGLVGALVAGGGVAAGDAVLTATGALIAGLGLVFWLVAGRSTRSRPPVPDAARRRRSG